MADSSLINGKGRFAAGPRVPLTVINVQQDKRYRFRLISISCDSNFVFSIDGHNFTVIEADGQNTQLLVVDSIQIFAGINNPISLFKNYLLTIPHRPALFFRS